MAESNLIFGWVWILCGLIGGATIGLFFHKHDWLGGYCSWSRRMVRLGHISFLGTGLLNLAFALSIAYFHSAETPRFASFLLILGGVTMPAVCFLSAWHAAWRYAFPVPVGALIIATAQLVTLGL